MIGSLAYPFGERSECKVQEEVGDNKDSLLIRLWDRVPVKRLSPILGYMTEDFMKIQERYENERRLLLGRRGHPVHFLLFSSLKRGRTLRNSYATC